MDSDHQKMLEAGLAAHEAGDLLVAEGLYQEVLKAHPDHGDANHAFGLLMIMLEKPALSLEFLRKAVGARPDRTSLWLDYLHGLMCDVRISEAWEVLRQAREFAGDSEQLDCFEVELLLLISEHNLRSASQMLQHQDNLAC